MELIRFTASRLATKGKTGVLKPDADGYYEIVLGGLNVVNSVGETYVAQGATNLFEGSSNFMRRVKSGVLKGEVGHPKPQPGQSKDQYLNRIMQIEETNVCCHIREVWLDINYGKNNPEFKNPDLIAIIAKVKPAGPKGSFLKEAFENGYENVCFSIRAFTRDYMVKGKKYRELSNIVTWDCVTEPGLHLANKWDSPAMECAHIETYIDEVITKTQMERIAVGSSGIIVTEDSKAMAVEILSSFNRDSTKPAPMWKNWT